MENETSTNAIEIRGLTKRFGRTTALNNLTFTVPEGVIAGFVGPNGSGKTTTLRVLATLLRQDAGQALVFGWDTCVPSMARQIRHAIGFMPDYFGLYTDMTPREYLDFFAAAYRIPAEKRAVLIDDMLALVGLTEKRDTLISGLSRGMQQKLSLGRALVHSPRLLLLDEPASGLDPRARIELMELLRELKNMKKTIFISSHILTELQNICDTVVIIQNGCQAYSGSMAEASDGLMEGRRVVELTVEGDPDSAVETLKSLPGVQAARRNDRILVVEHGQDLSTSALVEQCVKAGVRLEGVRRMSASLEEIFMHMTEEEGGGGAETGKG